MDTIRTVLGRMGVQKSNPTWVSWPPQAAVEADVQPRDQVTVGSGAAPAAGVSGRPWSALQRQGLVEASATTSGAAAAAVTGGPIGAVLTEETRAGLLDVLRSLEGQGIRLAQRQPDLNVAREKYRPMAPSDALAWLESQPATFTQPLVGYNAHRFPVGVSSLTDVMVLDALHGPAGAAQAPNAPLAEALRSLDDQGWKTSVRGSDVGADPLQAYTSLQAHGRDAIGLVGPRQTAWVHTPEDAVAIDFFDGSRNDRGLSRPEMATTLRTLGEVGYTFTAVDAQGRSEDAQASGAYMSLHAGGRVVVRPAGSKIAFFADEALLSSPDRVREREKEIAGLYEAYVLPILGESHLERPVDQAGFWSTLYDDLGTMPRDETCRRLATLTSATYFSARPVFTEILGAASADGNVDGRIADFDRISHAGMPDADRLPAFRYLDRDLREMAGADVAYTTLHDTFLDVLESAHNLKLAQKAVEVCTLPAGGMDFDQRAQCLAQVASCYHSDYQDQLVADFVALVNPSPRGASPVENARNFAETFGPLHQAFGRSASTDGVRNAHEARALVSLPVADESQAQRTGIMVELANQQGDDAIDVYRNLLVRRVPGESLAETADRFGHLATGLASAGASERTLEVFRTLQDTFRRDPSLDRGEVISRFDQAMVLSSDVDGAIAAATAPTRVSGTITADDATVTIGGIRLQRNPVVSDSAA